MAEDQNNKENTTTSDTNNTVSIISYNREKKKT